MTARNLIIAVAVVGLRAAAFAGLDCKLIMNEPKAGSTPQEILDTYRIQDADLKVCQAKADREAKQARARGDGSVRDGTTAAPERSKAC